MRLFFTIIALIFIIMNVGCWHDSTLDSRLIHIENIIEEDPESALNLLNSIDKSDLKDDNDKAFYGMLYTQALDKNYLEPTDDSMISFSVDFYRDKKDNLKKVISTYYQGRVYYHNKNYSSAILCFFKAKELAEHIPSFFWAAMASRGISDIYSNSFNSKEELNFARVEYEYMKKSGRQSYLNYALYDLGRALCNNEEYRESVKISEQLVDSAQKYIDPYLNYLALQLKSVNFLSLHEYEQASVILTEICKSEYANTEDSLNFCHTLIEKGYEDNAEQLLKSISQSNTGKFNMIVSMLAEHKQDYKLAFKSCMYLDSLANDEFRSSMNNNLGGTLIEYFELERKLDTAEIQLARIFNWLVVAIAVIVIIILCWIGIYIYLRQKRRNDDKMLLVEELKDSLTKSENRNETMTYMIKSIMMSKFFMLEELANIASTYSDPKILRHKFADLGTKIIDELTQNNDKIKELENHVDKYAENLFSDLKGDLPDLKEDDYRLFLFSVLGLSKRSIMQLLRVTNPTSLYNRTNRLKMKIKMLDENKQKRYLSYL